MLNGLVALISINSNEFDAAVAITFLATIKWAKRGGIHTIKPPKMAIAVKKMGLGKSFFRVKIFLDLFCCFSISERKKMCFFVS